MALSTFHVHHAVGLTPEAHPDFGLRAPASAGGDEDARMETDDRFLAAVVGFFAGEGATFEADLIYDEEKANLRDAAAVAGVELERGRWSTIKGPLLPPIPGAFPARTQLVLDVWVDAVERLHLHDDVDELYVNLGEDEVPVFLRRLELEGFGLERR